MSLENYALRFLGLSEQQIAQVHTELEEAEKTLATLQNILAMVKAEIPRVERQVATFKDALATVNANQRRFSGGTG